MRESIDDSGREFLVDAAASAQRARGKRDGNDDGKMADADWHLRSVAILGDGFAPGFGRLRSISSRCLFTRAALFRSLEPTP